MLTCIRQVSPTTGASVSPDGAPCTATTSTLFPGATFLPQAAAGVQDGFVCGTPTLTGYSLSDAQIAAMVASSNGSCSQQVSFTLNFYTLIWRLMTAKQNRMAICINHLNALPLFLSTFSSICNKACKICNFKHLSGLAKVYVPVVRQ